LKNPTYLRLSIEVSATSVKIPFFHLSNKRIPLKIKNKANKTVLENRILTSLFLARILVARPFG